eukprot:ANDGO_03049.mRNA.1 hypothetical protein
MVRTGSIASILASARQEVGQPSALRKADRLVPLRGADADDQAQVSLSNPLRPETPRLPLAGHVKGAGSASQSRPQTAVVRPSTAFIGNLSERESYILSIIKNPQLDFSVKCDRVSAQIDGPVPESVEIALVQEFAVKLSTIESNASLVSRVARLLLRVEIRDEACRNRVSKAVFNMSKDSDSDSYFEKYGLLDLLMNMKPYPDAFALGAIKNCTVSCLRNRELLMSRGHLALVFSIISMYVCSMASKELKQQDVVLITAEQVLQAIGILRNMCDMRSSENEADSGGSAEVFRQFSTFGGMESLCGILDLCVKDHALCADSLRVMSKCLGDPDCRSSLDTSSSVRSILSAMETHKTDISLVLRGLYILGRLTGFSAESRKEVIAYRGGMGVYFCTHALLLPIWNSLVSEFQLFDLKRKRSEKDYVDLERKSGEIEETLSKACRLLANISVEPNISVNVLADQAVLSCIFIIFERSCHSLLHPTVRERDVVEEKLFDKVPQLTGQETARKRKRKEELVLHTMYLIHNLSFYLSSSPEPRVFEMWLSAINKNHNNFSKLVMHLNSDIVELTVSCLGNVARASESLRMALHKWKLDELAVIMLDHSSVPVVAGACLVLSNMVSDWKAVGPEIEAQIQLWEKETVTDRLVDCVESFTEHLLADPSDSPEEVFSVLHRALWVIWNVQMTAKSSIMLHQRLKDLWTDEQAVRLYDFLDPVCAICEEPPNSEMKTDLLDIAVRLRRQWEKDRWEELKDPEE